MAHTHSLAEWLAFLSLGFGVHGGFSVPYFLFVEASLADFNPRPALARVAESGRVDPLLVAVVNARLSLRDAAVSVAALLLILTAPKGRTS